MCIKKVTLENGLDILFYQDAKKHTAYVNLITKFGGMTYPFIVQGKKYQLRNGMAHLLEHLLIEASPYGNLVHQFGEMQLSVNATTYINRTEYYFSGTEKIEQALPMLLKAVNDSYFTKEMLEKTKDAIYEEIRMGKDHKYRRLFEMQNENLFHNISYINSIGSVEDVRSFTYEEVKRCYNTFYNFSNQMLVIAGHFDENKLLDIIENTCKEIQRPYIPFILEKKEEPRIVKRKSGISYMPIGRPIIQLSYKISVQKFKSEQKLALDFYLDYFMRMNFGSISGLGQKMQNENITIGPIHFSHLWLDDILILVIDAISEKENQFIASVCKQIENPIFDKELFTLYQKESYIDIGLREENVYSYITPYLENVFSIHYPYPDTLEQISSYSFEEFKSMIEKLNFKNYTVCKIKDIEKEENFSNI